MNGITVLVDADACPVVKSVERIAKSHNVPVVLLCDTNHVLKSDYSEIKIIGAGADAVDLQKRRYCGNSGLRSCGTCAWKGCLLYSSVGENFLG